jgi:hypothetical protein
LDLGEVSVAVAVSAPHRAEAFDAARWAIDVIKTEVPIWKKETWQDGSSWGLDSHRLVGSQHDHDHDHGYSHDHDHDYDAPAPGSSSACR